MTAAKAFCKALLYVCEGEIIEILEKTLFIDALELPEMEEGRSTREWYSESLDSYILTEHSPVSDFIDDVPIPKECIIEILFSFSLSGYIDGYSGEFDEDVHFYETAYHIVSESFTREYYPFVYEG